MLSSPAYADRAISGIEGIGISATEESLGLSWEPVAGAVEYVAFEELPKPEQDRDPLEPVYRGEAPEFTHVGLGPRELSRIRILAVDENEDVLARALVRTSTSGAAEAAQEVSWIASSEGVEIFLGSQDDKVPLVERSDSRTFNSEKLEDTFFDPGFSGEPEIYEILSEEGSEPAPLNDPDENAPLPEKVPQNHVVEVPDFTPPASGDLAGEIGAIEEAMITQTMSRQFEWEAFIADDYISAPVFCDTAWDDIGNMHFGGDNRDFSRWTNGHTNRFRMSARADFNLPNFTGSPPTFAGWNDPSALPIVNVGPTTLFEEQADGAMRLVDTETAPLHEIQVDAPFVNRTTAEFYMVADSTNPLCAVLGIFEAPAINVSLTVILHADGSYNYAGARDGAPNHSAIIATHRIQTFPPPTLAQFFNSMQNPHLTCVHKHTNVGFSSLAFPPIPVSFYSSDHSDPSATGDCSTVNP